MLMVIEVVAVDCGAPVLVVYAGIVCREGREGRVCRGGREGRVCRGEKLCVEGM